MFLCGFVSFLGGCSMFCFIVFELSVLCFFSIVYLRVLNGFFNCFQRFLRFFQRFLMVFKGFLWFCLRVLNGF